MRLLKRTLIILLSVGWLAPLCISFGAIYGFLHDVVWPAAAFNEPYLSPWHPVDFADEVFYFAMGWLGFVIIGWSIHLTRAKAATSL